MSEDDYKLCYTVRSDWNLMTHATETSVIDVHLGQKSEMTKAYRGQRENVCNDAKVQQF